jgi:hypothetical protein
VPIRRDKTRKPRLEASPLPHFPPLHSLTPADPLRHEAETIPSPGSSRSSGRSPRAMVKVADDLTALTALSLFCEARIPRLDLTHSTIWSRSCHSHRHRHPLLEFVSTARTPPRPLQPVDAPLLDPYLFLIFSAAEPAPADCRSPSVSITLPKP